MKENFFLSKSKKILAIAKSLILTCWDEEGVILGDQYLKRKTKSFNICEFFLNE